MSAIMVTLRDTGDQRPKTKNGNLPPKRLPNKVIRTREYLTPDEVEGLITAAKNTGRHGHRELLPLALFQFAEIPRFAGPKC